MPKKITLETLASQMEAGFKQQDEKYNDLASEMLAGFKQQDAKFAVIEKKFEKIDETLGKLDAKIDGVERRFEESIQGVNLNLTAGLGRLESRLTAVETKLNSVAEDVSKIKLAVVDLMQTDRHLKNLVTELQNQGIAIDPARVFAA